MTIVYKTDHYCHSRVLGSVGGDTGRGRKKFSNLLGGGWHLRLECAKCGGQNCIQGKFVPVPDYAGSSLIFFEVLDLLSMITLINQLSISIFFGWSPWSVSFLSSLEDRLDKRIVYIYLFWRNHWYSFPAVIIMLQIYLRSSRFLVFKLKGSGASSNVSI